MLRSVEQSEGQGASARNRWTAEHVRLAIGQSGFAPDPYTAKDVVPIDPARTFWDMWPLQLDSGDVAAVAGGDLWIILSAPREADPNARHDKARMRLLFRKDGGWQDCGDLLPDGFSPGSREWSGSALLDPAGGKVTLFFTAAGRREVAGPSFEQRLFQAEGRLDLSAAAPRIADWGRLRPSVRNDGSHYADLEVNQGIAGRIKGFRDPYWFRDPGDGREYLLFTASKSAQASQSDYDGVVGIAMADPTGEAPYHLLPPLIDADGVSNELERPHVFVRDGLYYLFWSTQNHVFSPNGPQGPTGLYGMVAPTLFGPYRPLNGSGLVLANPAAEPRQAYAWQVLPSLEILSFVDFWGLGGREGSNAELADQFGGTIAPFARIAIEGDRTRLL